MIDQEREPPDEPPQEAAEDSDRRWSSDELKALLNQALALEFVKLQRRDSDHKAGFVLNFLKSAGGTALITIILGTFFGSWLAARIQENNKVQDESRASQQAAADRALENYKENLHEEEKTVEDAFSVAGSLIVRSRDLIDLTGPTFNDRAPGLSDLNRRLLLEQKGAMLQAYNDAHDTWQQQRVRLGLLLTIEHQNDRDTAVAWAQTSQAVSAYAACCLEVLGEHSSQPVNDSLRPKLCTTANTRLQAALDKLTGSIVAFRSKMAPQITK
jgi:hypothetical protein